VDANVPAIVGNWNSEELMKRAGSSLLKGETTLTTSWTGIIRTGRFEPEAVFAKAPAVILCRIVWQDSTWKIDEFRVKSDILNP
jgi:hypothetical protein